MWHEMKSVSCKFAATARYVRRFASCDEKINIARRFFVFSRSGVRILRSPRSEPVALRHDASGLRRNETPGYRRSNS